VCLEVRVLFRLRLGGSSRPADATELIGHASHVEWFQDSRHCTAMIPGSLIQRSRSRLPSKRAQNATAARRSKSRISLVLKNFRFLLSASALAARCLNKPGFPDFGTKNSANRDRGKIKSRIFSRSRPNRKRENPGYFPGHLSIWGFRGLSGFRSLRSRGARIRHGS
jgi:hypothetical protein